MAIPIYLDYNATTPVDPEVLEAMMPYFSQHFGNPSSKRHAFGWTADEAVTVAREQVADLVGAEPGWVHFTGGATEAINWGIKGFAELNRRKGQHIVTVATEHRAVLESCAWLEERGWDVTILDTDQHGLISPVQLEGALREDTVLVCCMWANNEIGTIHPVHEIVEAAHQKGVAVLVDATQAVGKIPVQMGDIDFLTCSAHKFYGPKGVGALLINGRRPRLRLDRLIHGGGQEFGRRAGTLNVPAIVGMGAAAEKAGRIMETESVELARMRDGLEEAIRDSDVAVHINGEGAERLPNTSSLTFPAVDTARLIAEIPLLAISTGSACSTGQGTPSHVLSAIGSDINNATLRVSLGRFTEPDEALQAAGMIATAVNQLQPAPQS